MGKGERMIIADTETHCEGCGIVARDCSFDHIIEAFEITSQILCDDCWQGFCDDDTAIKMADKFLS